VRKIRLFTPQTLSPDTTVLLEGSPANHLAKVLRARVGDTVSLFNGSGDDFTGQITAIDRRTVSVSLQTRERLEGQSPLRTHLGLCLSKGDRFDWAIQKATELGVDRITPLFSERVDVKLPADRQEKKREHWQGVVQSACEQCYRGIVPEVLPPQTLDHWVAEVAADIKLVLHHHSPAALPGTQPQSAALLIGPEGGLTEAEVTAAETAGFNRWCLGPRVLRTETAPIVALTALGLRWGDLA
jgi:16S rRNA (uracil1498-N3)-methyltransferase